MENYAEKTTCNTKNLCYTKSRKDKVKRKDRIRDMFLARQDAYCKRGFDWYTASQMAAVDTRFEFRITKKELMEILSYERTTKSNA